MSTAQIIYDTRRARYMAMFWTAPLAELEQEYALLTEARAALAAERRLAKRENE